MKKLFLIALITLSISAGGAETKYDRACNSPDKWIIENDQTVYCEGRSFEAAKKIYDAAYMEMKSYLAEKDAKDCEKSCRYTAKLDEAQGDWERWVESEFAYENHALGGAGEVTGRAFTAFRTGKMIERTKKLVADLTEMKKQDKLNKKN